MSMITCPHCKTAFKLEDVLTEDVEKVMREKYEQQNREIAESFARKNMELEQERLLFEEKKKRENEIFMERVKKESEAIARKREEELSRKLTEENKERIDFLLNESREKSEKLKRLQETELQVMELNQLLKQKQEEEEFKLKKQRIEIETELREKVSVEILDREKEKHELERRELEKKLSDQTRLIDEMQRKMQQGSMQTQGEVLELALEQVLGSVFPFDTISEVGKGKRGADCILLVRNEHGQECGRIIFESKRTKDFDKKWLGKLRDDARESKCDICVLVSQVLPEDIKLFDQREGVWITKLSDVVHLVRVLREGMMNVARANRSQENKGEKKEMLYNYFTGSEFLQQMRAINEAYLYLKSSIDRERFQMEKIWKEREKQIDKVLLNNNYMLGTIRGIAGNDIPEDHLLDG